MKGVVLVDPKKKFEFSALAGTESHFPQFFSYANSKYRMVLSYK